MCDTLATHNCPIWTMKGLKRKQRFRHHQNLYLNKIHVEKQKQKNTQIRVLCFTSFFRLLLLFVAPANITIVLLSTAQATNHDTNQIVNSNKMERNSLIVACKKMGNKKKAV